MLVHLQETSVLYGYVVFHVRIDDALAEPLDRGLLPANWREYPAPHALGRIGDNWLSGREGVALAVPSAVVPDESNYLLNPTHPDFSALRIEGPFPHDFDPRLLRS